MGSPGRRIDVEQAVLDPARHFERPADVLEAAGLGADDKRRILESWVRDADALARAEAENMPGDDRPHLREAKLALIELADRRRAP